MFEQARGILENPIHGESAFHARFYQLDYFIDSHDSSYSYVPPALCDYCKSSDHDAYNCPYHDYVDTTCANVEKTLNKLTDKMVGTIKERIS